MAALQQVFLATPWRPGGLSATDRALLSLVDEVRWMSSVVDALESLQLSHPSPGLSRATESAASDVLMEAATLLSAHGGSTQKIKEARETVVRAIDDLESHLENHFSDGSNSSLTQPSTKSELARQFIASLEFSFRSREVGFAAVLIATNIEYAMTAEQRSFFERLLGHEPGGTSPWTSARQRISSGLRRHSIWLHNSMRSAIGLGSPSRSQKNSASSTPSG